jgi:hypothetical protein
MADIVSAPRGGVKRHRRVYNLGSVDRTGMSTKGGEPMAKGTGMRKEKKKPKKKKK